MSTVAEDTLKLKAFLTECIKTIEKGEYAYVCDGYHGDGNHLNRYNTLIQSHSNKIVSKLVSLGYEYTTNHGHGCKDWSFSKPIDL